MPNRQALNSTFLKLANTSDCIDAGTDVGLPYTAPDPDLGYAEYAAPGGNPLRR